MVRILLWAAWLSLLANSATAAPPANADPALAPWFESLRSPEGYGCCSIADCRNLPTRPGKAGYEVQIDGEWIPVPPEKVIQRKENPTGAPVTCHAGKTIYCFVPGVEA